MSADRVSTDIAIIGISCRLPGAQDYRQFWRNLCDGVEAITTFTDADLLAAGLDPALINHPDYVKSGFVVPGVDRFDAEFFEFSPREARLMDPQHRLLLEVAWETFEDAGRSPGPGPRPVSVVVGTGGSVTSYLLNEMADLPEAHGRTANLVHIGNDKDFASTRISYKFNLTGPSLNVQTACSTSLVVVHLACQTLLTGEAEMALAAASTVRIPEKAGYLGQKGGLYSPDGHVHTFDAAARGTVFGSGVAAILLKRLDRALADGDPIHAVIRGSAVNNDGSSKASYSASNVDGQAQAMLAALDAADVDPRTLGYVECHGTGTMVGDPIEIDALTRAFRTVTEERGLCPVGSVKPNIGHPEQAAGLASLIKTVLALEAEEIPPTINLQTVNPRIDFANSPFFVATRRTPWPKGEQPRRALVNSLGIGGTNGVVILEEAPPAPVAQAVSGEERPRHLFALSAKSETALAETLARHRAWIAAHPDLPLADLCHTLAVGRRHFPYRLAIPAATAAELEAALADPPPARRAGAPGPIGFLFSGQGAQVPGMARLLYRTQPVFHAALDRAAAALDPHLDRPLFEVLFATDETTGALIHQTAYTQPALFAVEVALAEMLAAWGIRPAAVIGHSVGEFAAAHVAGVYGLEEAAALIAARARAMQALPEGGGMAAVFADEARVRALLAEAASELVSVAAVNGPQNTVISGPAAELDALIRRLEGEGIAARPLRVSHAFHSPLLQPAMESLRAAAAATTAQPPRLPWISNLSGAERTDAPDADYWCAHALGAVRFADGARAMAARGIATFIEIGPGKSLLTLARTAVGDQAGPEDEEPAWLATLGRDGAEWDEILDTLSALYRRGHNIDWAGFDAPYARRRLPLPTYAFQHESYWVEKSGQSWVGAARAPARAIPQAGHPGLAGIRLGSPLPQIQFETAWSVARLPWLSDHRVYGQMVQPTTAGLVMALDAARRHLGTDDVAVTDFSYGDALVLGETEELRVQTILDPTSGAESLPFQLASTPVGAEEADWRIHMRGMLRRQSPAPIPLFDPEPVKARCPRELSSDHYYAGLEALGLSYGPAFRAIATLWRGQGEVLARVRLSEAVTADGHRLHPALLDACLHTYPAAIDAYGDFAHPPTPPAATHLPATLARFAIARDGCRDAWVHVRRRPADAAETLTGAVVVDIAVFDTDGRAVATFDGLTVRPVPKTAIRSAASAADWLYRVSWIRAAAPAAPAADAAKAWLILANRTGTGAALAEDLRRAGCVCRVAGWDEVAPAGLDPDAPQPLAELLDAFMAEAGERPAAVAHLWGLDDPFDGTDATTLAAAERTTLGSAFALARVAAQRQADGKPAPRLWLVTRNAVAATGQEPPAAIVPGGLWGLGRTLALETPQLWGGLVDLDPAAANPLAETALLRAQLLAGDGETQAALRAGGRMVARFVHAPRPAAPARSNRPGSWLITGGLGALGVETARWLIENRGVRHLALASRRGTDDPNAAAVCASLAALGAQVSVVKADIGDAADTRRLVHELAAATPPLAGIIHSAGVLEDATLGQMTWGKFRRALAPKLAGAWHLHQASRDVPLDAFIVYSSILSLIGSAGQTNYTAGNACLDALVAHRRRLGLPAQSFNWGPWAAGGLATQLGEQGEAIWRARGLIFLPPDLGREALDMVAGGAMDHAAVILADWRAFAGQFPAPPKYYTEVLPARSAAGDGPGTDDLEARLRSDDPAIRRAALVAFIGRQVASTLGLSRPIDPRRPLREVGLDSLMSVTLINRVESALKVRIPAVKLIPGPSIEALVDEVWPDLASAKGAQSHPAPSGPEQSGGAPAPAPAPATAAMPAPVPAEPEPAAGTWLVPVGPRVAPRMRLFCFPFAGGGSAVYRDWAPNLDPAIEVFAVEPPGRLSRIAEEPVRAMEAFVDQVVAEMADKLDLPYALFGHCLGGLTMFEVGRRLIHQAGRNPVHIFSSGSRPPDRVHERGRFEKTLGRHLLDLPEFRPDLPPYQQPEEVFTAMLREFDMAQTDRFLEDADLRRLMLPAVRAEFEMTMTYEYRPERPWDVPITCFVSRGDPYVSREDILGWGRFTNRRLQVHMREGSHYSVVEDARFITGVINRELLAQVS